GELFGARAARMLQADELEARAVRVELEAEIAREPKRAKEQPRGALRAAERGFGPGLCEKNLRPSRGTSAGPSASASERGVHARTRFLRARAIRRVTVREDEGFDHAREHDARRRRDERRGRALGERAFRRCERGLELAALRVDHGERAEVVAADAAIELVK